MCLTSELETGCMVPCSRMGEVKEAEEARLAAEGIKESESGEKRGEQINLSGLPFVTCSVLTQAPSPASPYQHLKQDARVQFRFNLSSSPVWQIYFSIYSFIYLFHC